MNLRDFPGNRIIFVDGNIFSLLSIMRSIPPDGRHRGRLARASIPMGAVLHDARNLTYTVRSATLGARGAETPEAAAPVAGCLGLTGSSSRAKN